eukprot:3677535-Rhodomonas_salina.2
MRCPVLTYAMLLPDTSCSRRRQVRSCIPYCLRACYAVSGTDTAYGAICLCVRYAMSGTGIACATLRYGRIS